MTNHLLFEYANIALLINSLLLPSIPSKIPRTSDDAPNIILFSVVFLRPAPSLFPPFCFVGVFILIIFVS